MPHVEPLGALVAQPMLEDVVPKTEKTLLADFAWQ